MKTMESRNRARVREQTQPAMVDIRTEEIRTFVRSSKPWIM